MATSQQLHELQTRIHHQNVGAGWWDEERPFSTFICLFHSELSGAMEGDRKGLMDDHLPQYEMFWVELADFVIRCLDWLGGVGYDRSFSLWEHDTLRSTPRTEIIAGLHLYVSDAYECELDTEGHLSDGVAFAAAYAADQGVDLLEIIEAKLAYNKTRADHKRENRAKEGGKKY